MKRWNGNIDPAKVRVETGFPAPNHTETVGSRGGVTLMRENPHACNASHRRRWKRQAAACVLRTDNSGRNVLLRLML